LRHSILFNDLFTVSQIRINDKESIIAELFMQLEVELSQKNDSYQSEILRNTLRNVLLVSERKRRQQNFVEVKKGPDLDQVTLFKDLIEQQFREQKFISAYADQMHITVKRLHGVTSRILGKTPKQMIDERVMLEAKRLLVHSSESVKEIGYALGFDEPTNFAKYFRKHNNTTPLGFKSHF
jgi:AraC family transcriptional activator of pobA